VGDLTETLDHTRQGSALYDVERHKSHAYIYGGHDPGVCAASDGAIVLWLLGYPDQARERIGEAIRIAGLLSHAHSTAHAYCYAGIVHLLRREPNEALSLSEKLRAHSEENDLELWVANAKVLYGWSLAELGQTAEGLAEFREGIDQRNAVGATPRQSLYLASLALAYCDVGDFEEAEWAIAQAFKLGERFSDPYVHLAHGTIQLAETAGGDSKAEESLSMAIELSRERSARSWELRSATSLAKCWCDRGNLVEARDLLTPLYSSFAEGFDTPDLKDAKVLLDELS
jgi:predicted ATPase